jgi:hypothetical protein
MLPIKRAPKPKDFDLKVRQPGLRALDELIGRAPKYPRISGTPFSKIANRKADIPSTSLPSYWTDALDDLMTAYHEVCAYSCFRIHRVTGARSVDHFAPKSAHWSKVYEWSNYRLCCSRLNARKRDFSDVLDPFSLRPNAFQLELIGFQIIPDPTLPQPTQDELQCTIDRLGLNDLREDRAEDAEDYWRGDCSLKLLKRESPFVAYELARQRRLNAGDVW